jgi:ankyrin repeat protein
MYEFFEKEVDVNKLFLQALKDRDIKSLRDALSKGANVNLADSIGFNALHIAIILKNYDLCQELIQKGIEINKPNIAGITPLHLSINSDAYEISRLLLSSNASMKSMDCSGITPLMELVNKGNNQFVELFAQYMEEDSKNFMFKKLENKKSLTKKTYADSIKTIFGEGSFIIKPMMDYFLSLDTPEQTILIEKVKKYQDKIINFGEKWQSAASDLYKFSCFFYFYLSNISNAKSLWLDNQNNLNKAFYSLILKCALHSDFHSNNPILKSLEFQDYSLFILLLITFMNAEKEHPDLTCKLLNDFSQIPTINFNECNNTWGNTYLHFAIANAESENAIKFITILTKLENSKKLDVNVLSKTFGTTALHLAVAKGYRTISSQNDFVVSYLNLVCCLLENGADVNLKTAPQLEKQQLGVQTIAIEKPSEQTPLHIACARRDLEMIDILIQNGADTSLTNGQGQTPLEVFHLPREIRKEIVDDISGENLNNFFAYENEHTTEEHIQNCIDLLNKKPLLKLNI